MRLGKVFINREYVVDLDNQNMVEEAKDAVFDDLTSSFKYDELYSLIEVKEDPEANESDIADFLIEDTEEMEENDEDY